MGFGASTDHWGFAGTGINLISSTNPQSGSNAQSEDSNGDVPCETVFDTGLAPSATYEVCQGTTASFASHKLGQVISSQVITSIAATRNNKSRLQIVISGENMEGDSGATYTPVFPASYLVGGKGALEAGISLSAGRVISSSVTNTVQIVKGLDSLGNQACKEVYAGRAESTNEMQSCDTAPAFSAAASWTLMPNKTPNEDNSSYGSTTGGAFQNILAD